MERYFRDFEKKRKKHDISINVQFPKKNTVEYIPLNIPKRHFFKHTKFSKNKAGLVQL